MKTKAPEARRVTIFRDAAGDFRYRVQGRNWKNIGGSEEGFKRKATVVARIEKLYPGVEVRDTSGIIERSPFVRKGGK